MSNDKAIVSATPPSLIGRARVDFNKGDFNALIENKGYEVVWDKAIKCACNTEENDHALSSCQNCGSIGWVWVNRIQTRMILHSQNVDTQFKEWSETKIGTASLTCRDEFRLSFMDRVTLLDAENVYSERLYPQENTDSEGTATYAFTLYPIERLEVAFQFVDAETRLTVLQEGTDFTISNNIVTFTDNSYSGSTISVRYVYRPQYLVIDLPRETMTTPIKNISSGKNEDILMPIHAMTRRSHYVLDAENRAGNRLIDNSY